MIQQVKVLKDWGTYKKGDIIKMHASTAKGCAANGAVELIGNPQEEVQEQPKEEVQEQTNNKKAGK